MNIPLFPNYQPPLEIYCVWWWHVIKKLYESNVLYDFCMADPLLLTLSVWYLLHIFYPRRNQN